MPKLKFILEEKHGNKVEREETYDISDVILYILDFFTRIPAKDCVGFAPKPNVMEFSFGDSYLKITIIIEE